jgi:hypothetical protein
VEIELNAFLALELEEGAVAASRPVALHFEK